jgi:propionyl-CoA synthetase
MPRYADFYRQSIDQPDAFWAEQAQLIDWHTQPRQICDYSNPPFAKWFVGGTTNLCHNAVDRHLKDRASQPALVAISTETGTERSYSFTELHAEVQRMAAVLQSLGVKKGDRVLIYMPMVAEAAFAMLACVRIGALHSVVFGGFASGSLASRIEDAEPVAIVSADAGSRGGKGVPYKPLLDEAIRLSSHKPAAVLLVDRGLAPMDLVAGRDHLWAALREQHLNATVPCEWVDSTHPSYTLYTSGTTGKPKGVQRDTGATPWRWPQHETIFDVASQTYLPPATLAGWWAQLHHLRPADRRHDHHHVRGPARPTRRVVERCRNTRSRTCSRPHGGAC